MSDVDHFGGRFTCTTLAHVRPGSEGQPLLKRLSLPQGELAQCHDGDPAIRYIAAVELIVGTVRGNHSHQSKLEHVYVIQGEVELRLKDLSSGETAREILRAGDLAVIHPGIAHALHVRKAGLAVEFAPQRFDPSDVQRCELL